MSRRLRAGFMGSPPFAVPSLQATARQCELVVAVCQPDRPAGRGRKLTAPAVKKAAQDLDVPVIQPTKMKDGTLVAALREYALDIIVVVAFGRILPPPVLALPVHGCINVHGSLLPRWRGAAPIQRAVLAGDSHTGVTIMKMDEGLDTGPVYRTVRTPIGPRETSGGLFARLSTVGAEALGEFLAAFPDVPEPTPQPADGMTHAAMLDKSEGRVDWQRDAAALSAHIRGMDPWPAAVAQFGDKPLKLFGAEVVEVVEAADAAPGTVLVVDGQGLVVAGVRGAVRIAEVQPAGKRRMPAAAWAAGQRVVAGATLQ